jgi:hypothetical protein
MHACQPAHHVTTQCNAPHPVTRAAARRAPPRRCARAPPPVDQAWAFLDDDLLVPVDSSKPWNHIKDGQFGADPNFKLVVADRAHVADGGGHSEL